jgi:hypothetical protein
MSRLSRPFIHFAAEDADLVEVSHAMIVLLRTQIMCKGRRILFGCSLSGLSR